MKASPVVSLLALILLTGCQSGAYDPDRVAVERLERSAGNTGDLLLGRLELGSDSSHVLEVVGGPEIQWIALLPTPAGPGAAESYLVEVRFEGSDPQVVATVHVHEPTGLSIEHADGGGTNCVLGIAAGQLDGWSRGRARGYATLDLARRGVRLAAGSGQAGPIERD